MSNKTFEELSQLWMQVKNDESKAIQLRREIEDEMSEMLEIDPASESTINVEGDRFKVKIMTRLTRKVDASKLQEIAAEHDLSNELSTLFRWKAEIDMKSWKAAIPEVTAVLAQAVTTTAGRPSFSITKEEI